MTKGSELQTPVNRIIRFFQVFVILTPVLALAVAAGLLSFSAEVRLRVLEPIVLVDLGKFYKYLKTTVPDEARKLIGEELDGARFLNVNTPWKQLSGVPGQSFAVYDVKTDEIVVSGQNPRGLLFPPDASWIKTEFGLATVGHKKQSEGFTANDLLMRDTFFSAIRWNLLERLHLQDRTHNDMSLADVAHRVDEYLKTPDGQSDFWSAFRLASRSISFVVMENVSKVRAARTSVFFDNSRTFELHPTYIAGLKNSEFEYSERTNQILISDIWPSDKIIITAEAMIPIEREDLRLSWDEWAVIDKTKVRSWLILLGFISLLLVMAEDRWLFSGLKPNGAHQKGARHEGQAVLR